MWHLLGMTCLCRQVKQQRMTGQHHTKGTCMGTGPLPSAWRLIDLHTALAVKCLLAQLLTACCLVATAALLIRLVQVMLVMALDQTEFLYRVCQCLVY